jgi:hypothetical protein
MKRMAIMACLVPLLLSACAGLTAPESTATAIPAGSYDGLNLEDLESYRASFRLTFSGETRWSYQVLTRKSAERLERELHTEGITGDGHPGDVRLVREGSTNRMLGPGTSGQCLQYPSHFDVNIQFLSPDDILPPEDFSEPLAPLAIEAVAGLPVTHYAMLQDELDGWQEVQVGLWLTPDGGIVLRHQFAAAGWDPYFGAGYGTIEGVLEVEDLGAQEIESINGCEPRFPLPADARSVVILPELIAFESDTEIESLSEFYVDRLSSEGWLPLDQEDRSSGAIALRFRRQGATVDIDLRDMGEHRHVELLYKGP